MPVRLRKKNETASKAAVSKEFLIGWTLRIVFRFFHCASVFPKDLTLISPVSWDSYLLFSSFFKIFLSNLFKLDNFPSLCEKKEENQRKSLGFPPKRNVKSEACL
jgi:hypothetical protein